MNAVAAEQKEPAVQEVAAAYSATPAETPSLQDVLSLASRLALAEQIELIQFIAAQLSEKTRALVEPQSQEKSRSLHGLLAEYGPGPSAEEIDESRREMLANFPRDDIL